MTMMALYAVDSFRASESEAGLASSIFIFGTLLARLFAGKYVEVIGRKKLLYTSLILFLLGSFAYFPVQSLTLLLIVRFFHGAAFGLLNTALSTICLDSIPPDRQGEGTGYFSLSSTGATAIGPFLGVMIANQSGYDMMFAICTGFSLVAMLICFFTNIKEVNLDAEDIKQMKQGLRLQDFFEKNALPISIMMVITGIGYSSIISFLNTYAKTINLAHTASLYFVVYAIFLFIARPMAGKLLDTKGDNIVMYPAIFIYATSLGLLGITINGWMMILAGILLAFGYGTLVSSGQAIAVKVSPRHHIGLANSTFYIFLDIGMSVGPFIMGLIIPTTGYRNMYLILAIMMLCMVAYYYYVHGRKTTASPFNISIQKHTLQK